MNRSILVRRTGSWLAAVLAAAVLVSGCAFDPSSVPVPGASVSGPTYQIRIEFANALNLPKQAKVVANGAQIGTLSTVTVVDPSAQHAGRIDAIVEISESVALPTTTTAQLRQNTILGDIYIGLTTPPADFVETIAPGGTIPLRQTRPALQIEDLMAGMSTFIGGGALHSAQEIINRTNAVLPAQPAETARIFETLGRDAQDVADNLDSVERFLDAIQQDLTAVLDNREELDALLSERGARDIPTFANSLVLTLGVVGALGIVGHAVAWLGPFLQAGDAAAEAFVPMLLAANPLDLSAPSNLNRLVALLRDKVIPFVERGPKVNLTRIGTEAAGAVNPVSTDDQVDQIVAALRMIGAVR
ncbi:MlaD family protein [Nocardia sp. GCM10030253]|uniref:MlaD family protein n=1 Tax=Nocardia sp. GCM10030253 TaxID=3273404 RepID=UPI003635704F